MTGPATCGIDVGTSGVRAVVVDGDGSVVGRGAAALRRTVGTEGDGRHEQDPAGWWDTLTAATRAATEEADAHGVRVEALALDATSGTILVEDDHGAVGPALMYDDARAADLAEEADTVGADVWRRQGYRIQGSWALPKLLWLVREGHLGRGRRLVHQADHLLGRLAGHPVPADTSHGLKTGVDLHAAAWPTDVLAELGVVGTVLPALVLPGTEVGRVGDDVAAETGLPAGTVLRAGMTDGCAAQISAGALAPGSWSSALGTTLVLKGSTRALVHDLAGGVYSHRHPDGGWLPGGASSSGAGVFAQLLPDADLAALTETASQRPLPDARYPLHGRGERFPFISDASPELRGTRSTGDDAGTFASLALGLAFVERLAYDVLAGLGADVDGEVALSGGGTRNPWLNQLRTDTLGRTTRLAGDGDAALGMAVLAAAEPGRLTDAASRLTASVSRLRPDPTRADELDEGYHRFVRDLVDAGHLDADRAGRALPDEGRTS